MDAYHLNLATQRQQRGITLEQIAAVTKIGVHFLSAIETENYSELPGGVYNTSYIRQYAQVAGFDAAELVEHYRSLTDARPDARQAQASRDEHAMRSFVELLRKPRRDQHAA